MAQHGKALALNPDYAEVHYNRSLLRLLTGDLSKGWPEYEWRWTQPGFNAPRFCPTALGRLPLNGRTILLYADKASATPSSLSVRRPCEKRRRPGDCPMPAFADAAAGQR